MFRPRTKRIAKTVAELIAIIVVLLLILFVMQKTGIAEETEAYALCADFVNVRQFPNRKGDPIGRLEAGDRVWLDGKKRNGYVHCVDMGLESDGWVYAGFIVYDRPEKVSQKATITSRGRLAARKYVNGRRTRWLKSRASVFVYWWSDDWCVTNCGYIQSKYLELEGE